MSVPIARFVKARRDRALGSILGYAEREFFNRLSEIERRQFRSAVVDALNGFYDSVLDLVKSEDSLRNDKVIELLERLDSHLTARR